MTTNLRDSPINVERKIDDQPAGVPPEACHLVGSGPKQADEGVAEEPRLNNDGGVEFFAAQQFLVDCGSIFLQGPELGGPRCTNQMVRWRGMD
jgi:hypothetical protein